jgi:GGDEF domain-containing protein
MTLKFLFSLKKNIGGTTYFLGNDCQYTFFVESLNRAVLEENRSIKTVSESLLCHFTCKINYLPRLDLRSITLFMVDIDDFKKFNDNFGHLTGDKVLAKTGAVIRNALRETDSGYRYGGEEFAISCWKRTALVPFRSQREFAQN